MPRDTSPFLEVPTSQWLSSNRSAFAILDKFPVSPGHSLIIPRRLIATWWEASRGERVDLMDLLDEVKVILDSLHTPAAYNVGFNSGRAAGQTVDHLHLHVIPRYHGDSQDPTGGIRNVFPDRANYLRPTTPPAADSFHLLDGIADRHLQVELLRCLINPEVDLIDIVVSFVMRSGVDLLYGHLADALNRGATIRLLTTDYLNITDHLALARLADLAADHPESIEIRVFQDPSISFHPKAYIFRASGSTFAAGFVGSSNLSASGLAGGVEWNLGVRQVAPLVERFQALWDDPRNRTADQAFLQGYKTVKRPPVVNEPPEVGEEPIVEPVTPRPIQREALDALETTRQVGHHAGLVVLATGLGKTWLAAFDSARPQYRRVLFVAHREEILRQSRDVFRQVHPDADLGLYMGPERDHHADVLFASIQTIARHLGRFPADTFDYVVVDEFHHASAPSYRRLIDHFRPKFLLGLTATPQRMDGADLLALCNDNLAFECLLVEGIERGDLVAFHYWGIRDVVDFAPIPWRNGRFDPAALTAAVETQERAQQALREWEQHRGSRTLAFCCSVTHADFMAEYFRGQGVRALAAHSGATSAPRHQAIEQLRAGDLDVVFSVDVFNEGVDVPEVDTVLMLRPTDSPIVFLQQLGRGLRVTTGKDHLRVIDLIGNHRSFLIRPRTLLALVNATMTSNARVLEAVESGEFGLPPGCSVDFDLSLLDMFKQLARVSGRSALEEYCRQYFEAEGARPTATQAMQAGFNPASVRQRYGNWFGFLDYLGMMSAEELSAARLHGDELAKFETEAVYHSHKLVALRAMLRSGVLCSGAAVSHIASTCLTMVLDDPRLRADIESPETGDLSTVATSAWRDFWLRWPLTHMASSTDKPDKLFQLEQHTDDTWFVPRFRVADDQREAFENLVGEIVDWRLQRFLLNREAADPGAPVMKVNHSGGNPILMLDRNRYPELPRGETDFLADGERYTGRFVKIALNVATRPGQPGNALHELLRRWFGPNAGLPGTAHRVRLKLVGDEWVLAPVDRLAESAADGKVVPLFASFDVACGAFGQVDPNAQRSGWLELADTPDVDLRRCFVAFARGDSMEGGTDPIRHGDPLLFEWVTGRSNADLAGQRVLVAQQTAQQSAGVLKMLDRTGGRYVLRSTNPDSPDIDADGSMRVVARLVRPLVQAEVNPWADVVGQKRRRVEMAAMYGVPGMGDIRRAGYARLEQDALLIVTLNKEGLVTGSEYVDHFESDDTFMWSSQANVGPEGDRGREVLDALATGLRLHLWIRPDDDTREYWYCGLVAPISHEGSKPMQVRFRLLKPLAGPMLELRT